MYIYLYKGGISMSKDLTMDNIIEFNNVPDVLEKKDGRNNEADIEALLDELLLNVPADFAERSFISMPIAELATLGTGMASLLPTFRTVTQTTEVGTHGLYQLANAVSGDVLKAAKDGTSWAAFKTVENKYKHNWDNERFINSNYKMVCDIQRTALKHMTSYEDRISKLIDKRKGLLVKSKVESLLADLQKDFSYYRLSLYTFSMASFMEIMLSEKYTEALILKAKKTLETEALNYRKIYSRCSAMLEQVADKSIEQNLMQGIGFVGKKAGELIGEIPLIKEGPVDEFLQESGAKLDKSASRMVSSVIMAFSEMADPRIGVFTEKMDDMIQIYNHTEAVCFDKEKIYFVG